MRTTKVLAIFAVLLMAVSPWLAVVPTDSEATDAVPEITDSYYLEADGSYTVTVKLNTSLISSMAISAGVVNGSAILCGPVTISSPSGLEIKLALSKVSSPSDINGALVYITSADPLIGTLTHTVNCLVTVDLSGGTAPSGVESKGWVLDEKTGYYSKSYAFGTKWASIQNDFGTPSYDGHSFSGWNQIAESSIERNSKMVALWDKTGYNITVEQTTGGTVSADASKALEGTRVNLSYVAAQGYELKKWIVKAGTQDVKVLSDAKGYYFVMPAYDVLVKAEFTEITDLVIVTAPEASEGFTVSAETKKVPKGADYTFTLTISYGYVIDGNELQFSADGTYGSITATRISASEYSVTVANVQSDISKIHPTNIVGRTTVVYLNDLGGYVTATFNRDMPKAEIPVETGKIFMGYFSEKNGQGTQYYYKDMSSAHVWDQDKGTALLYAYFIDEPLTSSHMVKYDTSSGTVTEAGHYVSISVKEGAKFLVESGDYITRENYDFVGWTDGNKVYSYGTPYFMGTSDVTLKPVWQAKDAPTPQPTTTPVTIIVTNESDEIVIGASVYIDGVSVGITNDKGRVTIIDVPYGPHSIVAKTYEGGKESSVVTTAIEVSDSAKEFTVKAVKDTSSVIVIESGSEIEVVSGNLDKIAEKAKGHTIELVIDNSNATLDSKTTEIAAMKEAMGVVEGDGTQFFDAALLKDGEPYEQGDLVEIIIAFDYEHKVNFSVSHYHDGKATLLTQIEPDEEPSQDTYYLKDGYIHIFTKKFSTFGLGYETLEYNHAVVTFHDSGLFANVQKEKNVAIGKLPIPSKEGQTFLGWYTADDERITPDYIVTGNVDLFAKWTDEKTYTVKYDTSSAVVDKGYEHYYDPQTYKEGDVFRLLGCHMTKDGYSFVGWTDGAKTYLPGEIYRVGSSDVTFEPVWKANEAPAKDNSMTWIIIGVCLAILIIAFIAFLVIRSRAQ